MKKISLVNPPWHLSQQPHGFGCQAPHTPLEFLYALSMLEETRCDEVQGDLVDAHLLGYSFEDTGKVVASHQPDCVVITTASGYSNWRTPTLDLSVPLELIGLLRQYLPETPLLVCGPHGSSTPDETFKFLGCDGVIRGEPEEVIASLDSDWRTSPHIFVAGKHPWNVDKAVANMGDLPAIDFSVYPLQSIQHIHRSLGPIHDGQVTSVDVEWSRGCQYACTFCNRADFRNKYRERPIETVITELMALRKLGVHYVSFIDEVFGLGKTPELLIEMRRRPIPAFGIQTRVDLWDEKSLDFLAAAGCHHIEFGLESPLADIQQLFHRDYTYSLKRTEEVLLHAVSRIRSVQVSLLDPEGVTPEQKQQVSDWREKMISRGCWVSEPVKAFPYPGTLYYKQRVAPVSITADGLWEKATKFYTLEASRI
jgi:B12-binding domain/radical SAM domain protein of rhizo-twelve system